MRSRFAPAIAFGLILSVFWGECILAQDEIAGVPRIPAEARATLYPSNREPLVPSPLVKLPIGAITPKGWLREMLVLESQGMTGRLAEVSPWLKFDKSPWADKEGKRKGGWEEVPYWLKGYADLGYVLKDEAIIANARKWIDAALASQREDGWFGPRDLLTSLEGKPDLWSHMVMLNVLQSYYEYSGDARVLPFMAKYFQWQGKLSDENLGAGYWPKMRMGDNIESVLWLYNRTGDASLLKLAERMQHVMADWTSGIPDWHNVNIAQCFRAPAMYYPLGRDRKFLDAAERNYQTVMGVYGQFPGGGFAGDEVCRPGYGDPRQGFETCGIVEFMHSFELLTRTSGEPIWADRCEEIAANSFPASQTPELTGLHYLTGANMVQLDRAEKHPGFFDKGMLLTYSAPAYRCCEHNVAQGWPYYAEELWLATSDGGLCASLYAASELKAKVADGTVATIAEETEYPFGDTIRLKVSLERPTRFPLYLRVPRWSGPPELSINGKPVTVKADPLSYVAIKRDWSDGDTIEWRLPMRVTTRTWAKNGNGVSVDYGPLTFSLKIGERWERSGTNKKWPDWEEVFPTTPWNYGLVLDPKDAAKSFTLQRREGPLPKQPFTLDTAPLWLRAKGKRIPDWKLDAMGLTGLLPPSPVASKEPVEDITLIPMGAARLRISVFPTVR